MSSLRGYLFIIGAALFWGISATVAKSLFNSQVNPLVLVQLRMTLSCLLLASYFLIFKRHLLQVKAKDLYKFALLGIFGMAGSNFFYYFTIKEINVATAILLQYLAPLIVLGFAAVTNEEELTMYKIIAGVVSLLGCFLAVGGYHLSFAGLSTVGLVSGLLAACSWAFTNIWLRKLVKQYNIWTSLIYAFIFASIFWMFFNTPLDLVRSGYPLSTWMMYLGFAVISILIPHSLYFSGIKHLTASRAIITASFEPVIAIGLAFIFLQETLTPIQMSGSVLVIAAIGILQLKKEQQEIVDIPAGGD